jgi:hypothetical protein
MSYIEYFLAKKLLVLVEVLEASRWTFRVRYHMNDVRYARPAFEGGHGGWQSV